MFAAFGGACRETSVSFVSQAALDSGIAQRYQLGKRLVAVHGTRRVRKADLVHNNMQPHMEVDPQTYAVRADGVLLTCEPLAQLPLTQRYFLF